MKLEEQIRGNISNLAELERLFHASDHDQFAEAILCGPFSLSHQAKCLTQWSLLKCTCPLFCGLS